MRDEPTDVHGPVVNSAAAAIISGMSRPPRLLIFTDLDGCLLNKHDYHWRDAEPCLQRLRQLQIPVILCSSKTRTEMEQLAVELPLIDAPLIAENGGTICWGPAGGGPDGRGSADQSNLGAERNQILQVLGELKGRFQFRSFRDLGVPGVMQATDLTESAAAAAMDRHSTEPLLWDDDVSRIPDFKSILQSHGLTFTRGGRFWHVAGRTSKGAAALQVAEQYGRREQWLLAAIGDSQIDQSMLDIADVPIGIRVHGDLNVQVPVPPGIIPESEGAKGWAEAVTELVDRIR